MIQAVQQQHTHTETLKPSRVQALIFCWTSNLLIRNSYLEVQLKVGFFFSKENPGTPEKDITTHPWVRAKGNNQAPNSLLALMEQKPPWLLIPETSKELSIPYLLQQ